MRASSHVSPPDASDRRRRRAARHYLSRRSDARARSIVDCLLPDVGPWARRLLWYGFTDRPALTEAPLNELPVILAAGLGPTLEQALEQSKIEVSASIAEQVRLDAFARQAHSHGAIVAALSELDQLREHGIDYVVIKGPGVANAYGKVLTRPFGDLDVWVRPSHFNRARALLGARGWQQLPKNRAPWPFFDRWCREGINLRHSQHGGNIDLHHRPSPWLWSEQLNFDAVASRANPITWFGREIVCASEPDNLLIVALQLLSDHHDPGGKLLSWRDVAVLANRVSAGEAAKIAAEAGLADYLMAVLANMPPEVTPEAVVTALRRSSTGRLRYPRRLAAVADRSRTRNRLVMQIHARRLPTGIAAIYLAGTVVPSSAFIREQTGSKDASFRLWWRYAIRESRHDQSNGSKELS